MIADVEQQRRAAGLGAEPGSETLGKSRNFQTFGKLERFGHALEAAESHPDATVNCLRSNCHDPGFSDPRQGGLDAAADQGREGERARRHR